MSKFVKNPETGDYSIVFTQHEAVLISSMMKVLYRSMSPSDVDTAVVLRVFAQVLMNTKMEGVNG